MLVRNAMFRRVELAALRRWRQLASSTPKRRCRRAPRTGATALEEYFAEHDSIDTGPDARGPADAGRREGVRRAWRVQQILGDPEGDHDWRITAEVDLDASDDEGELVMEVTGLVQLLTVQMR